MSLDIFKKNNKFLMMALDHRQSFNKIVNPVNPEKVTVQELVAAKRDILKALVDLASGVLVDVKTGLPAYQLVDKAQNKPLVLAIEKSGYVEKEGERLTELAYTVSQLKKLGAQAIKLLVYFNPLAVTSRLQLLTAQKVLADCRAQNLPLFLEIVTYHSERSIGKDYNLVVESIKRFLSESIRPDVFKIEFPGSKEASLQITHLLKTTPWILLTRGENYYLFKHQLQEAMTGGCQGFLAGRAIWQELGEHQPEKREQFLKEVVTTRFEEIVKIALT